MVNLFKQHQMDRNTTIILGEHFNGLLLINEALVVGERISGI